MSSDFPVPPIPGVTLVDMNSPEAMHNTIAAAVGEPEAILHVDAVGGEMTPHTVIITRDTEPTAHVRPYDIRIIDFETSDLPGKGGVIIETGWTDVKVLYNAITYLPHSHHHQYHGVRDDHSWDITAQSIHHISKRQLAGLQPFDTLDAACLFQCEPSTTRWVDFLVAHNARFEQEMLRKYVDTTPLFICTMKCARQMFPEAKSHSLQYLRYFLDLENGEYDHRCMPPHAAGPDTWVTFLLLKRMLQCGVTLDELANMSNTNLAAKVCPFGKWKGHPWSIIDVSYLHWIVKQEDMDPDVKNAAQFELANRSTGY